MREKTEDQTNLILPNPIVSRMDEVDTDFTMMMDENSDSPSDRVPNEESDSMELASTDTFDYGEMNEQDAVESGYTDPQTHKAQELARPDIEGSPTGALTDVGKGHSSAVHRPD